MIKNLAPLLIFGLAYSNQAIAQELGPGDIDAAQDIGPIIGPPPDKGPSDLGSPFYPSLYPRAMLNQTVPTEGLRRHNPGPAHSFGRPIIVLPLPPDIHMRSGFQYPGSYLPRDTPLHRFNGYIVCNPPNLTGETTTETTTETTAGAKAQRLVKITSTRSLAVPSHQQPCPIYTINGELQQQKSYATTTMPSTRNAPSRQKGERQ